MISNEFKTDLDAPIDREMNYKYSPFLKDAISKIKSLFPNNENDESTEPQLNQIISEINEKINEMPKGFQQTDFLAINNLLLKLFQHTPLQSNLDFHLLNCFQLLLSNLPDEIIHENVQNQAFIEKIIDYLSNSSTFIQFIDPASMIASKLIKINAIPDYNTQTFLEFAPKIANPENRSFYLSALAINKIDPIDLSLDFFPIVLDTFTLSNPKIVENCCDSICDCLADLFEDDKEFSDKKEAITTIFTPFLIDLQPHVADSLRQKELLIPLIELFRSLVNKMICPDFFADEQLSDLLIEISIHNEDKFYFNHIFNLISDIFEHFPQNHAVTPEFFNYIINYANEGSFNERESSIRFIASVIDQVIDDSPEYFHDYAFFDLLTDMLLTTNDGIETPLLQCTSKLLSARDTHFLDYLTSEEMEETLEDIQSEFENLQDEMQDDEIDSLIRYITQCINDSKPRDYERGFHA